jgi:putative transposase
VGGPHIIKMVGWASVPAIRFAMTDNAGSKWWVYRRRMPHWRLEGSVYFVTWRLDKFQRELEAHERTIIVSSLKHFERLRFDLFAFVVMPDHVHVLVKPYEGFFLHELVHSWKSFSAHRLQRDLGREGRIWQEDYFDRIMRGEPEFLEKVRYILNNPLKIKEQIDEYPWVWVRPAME